MRAFLRQFGLGRSLYHLWYRPLALVGKCLREGGPIEQWKTARGRAAMAAAAGNLPLLPEQSGTALRVHVLTGARFWYQTAFCLWSFARTSQRTLSPVVLDDGTLRTEQFAHLQRLFPRATLIAESLLTDRLDQFLPTGRFPSLRARRATFPLLRKLTDVHVGQTGWKLFLDSDMLFFNRPQLLVQWLDNPQQSLHATDVDYAYGYERALLAEMAGKPVVDFINTGILGLRSEDFDWEQMEFWCQSLISRAGPHYYQEQALVALHLAGRPTIAAPLADYVTFPRGPEVFACARPMHHYVASSKRFYFQRNWRHALTREF